MTSSELVTLILAVWGALLSTVLGVLTILRERKEDGRLRIRVWVLRVTGHDYIRPFCSFEVVNIGRRPVHFAGLILHDRNGKYVDQVLGPIEEGTYITWITVKRARTSLATGTTTSTASSVRAESSP